MSYSMSQHQQPGTRPKQQAQQPPASIAPLLGNLPSKSHQSSNNQAPGAARTAQKPSILGFKGKTVWDLLGVILIPIAIAGGSLFFSWQQNATNAQIAKDQQHEATFKTYVDDIKDLLLNRNLIDSKPTDEVRTIARTETLLALRQLDSLRNDFLLQFLRDAHLVGNTEQSGNDIISFVSADLRNDHLEDANLKGIDLRGADLGGQYGTFLTGADLTGADLARADLTGAHLGNANLTGTDLSSADLKGIDLNKANLRGAKVTQLQLSQAESLQEAIMPDGSKHP